MKTLTSSSSGGECRDLSFGLMTKARAYKGAGQEGSPIITFHTPRSVGECEGMNLNTPKWAPILEVGFLMDFQIFNCIPLVKINWIKNLFKPLQSSLKHKCLKWACMTHLNI